MFNNRVRRYRLTVLLLLAGLVLFGISAGHLATRALGAQGWIPATTLFGDRLGDGLRSDGEGLYGDPTLQAYDYDCVFNALGVVSKGTWKLATPYGCSSPPPPPRSFTLVLPGQSLTGACDVSPDPDNGGGLLHLCGVPNEVWGNMATNVFTSDWTAGANPMSVFISTGGKIAFRLTYRNRLSITRENLPADTMRSVTADDPGSVADLYKYVSKRPGPAEVLVGTFSVPCKITATKP